MDHPGACHCGAIGFTFRTRLRPEQWSIRACQCTFCRAHDALSTSDPNGALEFTATQPEMLQKYRFGLGTADFLLCRNCGIYLGAAIESGSGRFGIINTHALAALPDKLAHPVPVSYDSENPAGRISRRGARWTPVTGLP